MAKSRVKKSSRKKKRFEISIEKGPPHGDLFELEQTTYYHIVNMKTREKVMTFQSELESTFNSSGLWGEPRCYGVNDISITDDQKNVRVTYYDGREELLALPDS